MRRGDIPSAKISRMLSSASEKRSESTSPNDKIPFIRYPCVVPYLEIYLQNSEQVPWVPLNINLLALFVHTCLARSST